MSSRSNAHIGIAQIHRGEIKATAVFLCGALIFGISSFFIFTREYVNFGVESDLFLRFIQEAELLRQGQALTVEYHLPFYSALLAGVEYFTIGWFEAGLIITWVSTLVALVTSYRLARDLLGWQAGLGVLVVCGTSVQFLTHSSGASTDMLFLALYQSTCLAGLSAFRTKKRSYWLITGILIAFSYLTRSNGIVLVAFLGVPFLLSDKLRLKIDAVLVLLLGILIGFTPWATYAVVTGSPLLPTHSHLTLARTFYDLEFGVLTSSDFVRFAETKFENVWDVLAFNPARIPVAYAENVANFVVDALPKLVSIPLLMLLMPGLLVLILGFNSRFLSFLAFLTVCHFLLNCFADFSPRYFLFLVPFFGMALSTAIKVQSELLQSIGARRIFYGMVGICALASLTLSIRYAWKDSRVGLSEVAAVTPELSSIVTREVPVVVAMKPQLVYHARADWAPMPIVKTLAELREQLMAYSEDRALYLYFGSREARYRPELAQLRHGVPEVRWLIPAASGPQSGGWTLYLVENR